MLTVLINGTLGFIMLVTFCFCLGDVQTILSDARVMPFVQTFLIATKSHAGTSVMTTILIMLTTCGCITNVATASRQMFAFARDQGLPFSKFLSHVSEAQTKHKLLNSDTMLQIYPGWDIPLNAVVVSLCVTILLSLINIGSNTALNAIISLGVGALISSYIISISCVIIKRYNGEKLPHARWSLGRWGGPINIVSVLYLSLMFMLSFFPSAAKVKPETMNWGSLMYGFTVLFAIGWFLFRGKRQYLGPVEYVRKDL